MPPIAEISGNMCSQLHVSSPPWEEIKVPQARLPERLVVTTRKKCGLLKFGRNLGAQLRDLTAFVSYQTFVRWIRFAETSNAEKQAAAARKLGRPRTADDIRELSLKLPRGNSWDCTRILGELRKQGMKSVSWQTVKLFPKDHDIDPRPKRGNESWEARLSR